MNPRIIYAGAEAVRRQPWLQAVLLGLVAFIVYRIYNIWKGTQDVAKAGIQAAPAVLDTMVSMTPLGALSKAIGLVTGSKSGPTNTTNAQVAAAKKAETERAYSDATGQRRARAADLTKKFQTQRYLRVMFLENVAADVVTKDTFGAIILTGQKIQYKKGQVLSRDKGFIQTTTGKGNLVLTDMVRQYAVNPNVITLT